MTTETYVADGAMVGRIFGEKENTAPLQEIASLVQQIEAIMDDSERGIMGVSVSDNRSYVHVGRATFLENFTEFEFEVLEGIDYPYEFIAEIDGVKFMALYQTGQVLELKDTHPEIWEFVQRKVQENPTKYWYEMLQRPTGPGCQPKGLADMNPDKGRHGIVAYGRELTEKELNDYDMRKWQDPT